jgi:coenzyme F420-reducing hydrogenase beta subunit
MIETTVARAADPAIRRTATNGGVATALLPYLEDQKGLKGVAFDRSE